MINGQLTILLAVTYFQISLTCFGGKKKISFDDCKSFPKGSAGCKRVFLGKRQTEDLTLGLYDNVAKDKQVDQENFLLVPIELGRVISALIHASTSPETVDQDIVDQIRCYLTVTSNKMYKGILAHPDYDKEKEQKRYEKDLVKAGNNKTRIPKMVMIDRQIFVDKSIQASENYTKEALCWYETPISKIEIKKNPENVINEWAKTVNEKALASVSGISEKDPARKIRHPLAGDPKVILNEMAVVASSIFLKVAWKKNLFSSKRTKPSEPFFVKVRGDGPHENAETNVKIPMMTAVDKFHFLDVTNYRAIALPLAEGPKSAFFMVVLPKKDSNLTDVEEEIFGSGTIMHSFMENVKTSQEKLVSISLPRLTIQITHEWGTPTNKTLQQFANKTGRALQGDAVGVYHDTFLEMIESTNDNPAFEKYEKKQEDNNKDAEMTVNQPFLFIFTVDRDIIAFGRIRDPYWCKFCQNKHGGGNHTAVPANKAKMEKELNSEETRSKSFFGKLKDILFG